MEELKQYKLNQDPLESFKIWYQIACKIEENADAMTVSTIDFKLNRPVTRSLLFKGFSGCNFIFYTNYLSQKSNHLDHNPEVCLHFYWLRSMFQIRVQGRVSKMGADASKNYFYTRDLDSQIASFISMQSHPIESKTELLKRFGDAKNEFSDKVIPMPPHWGGYLVEPYEYEFFIYGKNRLNDRFLYQKESDKSWNITRLQP